MPVRENIFQSETIEDVVDAYGEERLTGYALLNIHREMSADLIPETVIDRYVKTKKRDLDVVCTRK